jgi:hypothetical protein
MNAAEAKARHLYETIDCARGEMKSRFKECQLDLFADRTAAVTMREPATPVVHLRRRRDARRAAPRAWERRLSSRRRSRVPRRSTACRFARSC